MRHEIAIELNEVVTNICTNQTNTKQVIIAIY